jgi:hypothetical protein
MEKTARNRLGKENAQKRFPLCPQLRRRDQCLKASTLFCDKPNVETHANGLGIPDESPHACGFLVLGSLTSWRCLCRVFGTDASLAALRLVLYASPFDCQGI